MFRFFLLAVLCWATPVLAQALPDSEVRTKLSAAILAEDETQEELIQTVGATGSPLAAEILGLWRQGSVYLDTTAEGDKIPFIKKDGASLRIDTGAAFTPESPTEAETSSKLRKSIRTALDLMEVADPDPKTRASAIQKLGGTQNDEYLPVLKARLEMETDKKVRKALEAAIATIDLTNEDDAVCIAAIQKLGALKNLASMDTLKAMITSEDESDAAKAEAQKAVSILESYSKWVNAGGTLFSGLSAGSVLLVVALGLAITFGLMGVINMAHGEIMAVGAYTTYFVQNIFGAGLSLSMFGQGLKIPGMNLTGSAYQSYFIWAIPASFLTAALVGIALERGVIRFLYKRPLESLLATWGISLILQQLFKLVVGPNNVSVSSPTYLSGSFIVSDVSLGFNRVFVICFAAAIVFCTWLLLTKTRLGLFIRAVMQNRQMAACMGVRTERVNMLTFGFGSGLAGLGGAFLSQLGNVGPNLGQDYIVDSFMTVVVGGVGNLIGTVCSAIGIGTAAQSLQAVTDPSMGKVLALGSIILFLLWRPGGLFPTRTRSLEG
ncbi:MAG: urea ABC transporter permease subunit UrtB [Verrucomicrobiaceae bacterium]|nr:MAG: urea ABC transporter permease subunit UrtB [Verrucomicrobiaceae bacterium]